MNWMLALAIFSQSALASTPPRVAATIDTKPKYKQGRDMSFDSELVEGQIYRPDLSVVTGDTALGSVGDLRLRKNFIDHALSENGAK